MTYTPSKDRILPLPSALHLRIKNTASLPFRAAYLHGPYTLYVSVRRQEFEPWQSTAPDTNARADELRGEDDSSLSGERSGGIPAYEPQLKAGASFYVTLPIPPKLIEDSLKAFADSGASSTSPNARKSYENGGKVSLDGRRTFAVEDEGKRKSVTWIIEVISQVIFSTTATVGYEILLGRDEKSLSFAYPYGPGNNIPRSLAIGSNCGVMSMAVSVMLQDTQELWNLPQFPSWEQPSAEEKLSDPDDQDEAQERRKKQKIKRKTKRVHLVILTHGLHSNTGADMLFLKESIDEEERKAASLRQKQREMDIKEGKISMVEPEEDSEQVIVRGYHDNCCRTERGIKYLGKRLARYVLHLVNPGFDLMPTNAHNKLQKSRKPHHHPHLTSAARTPLPCEDNDDCNIQPYKITSISFIGHSLGGLVQMYAIAYIHAHSPTFFHDIKPINFVALATPFLGLSNENPLYVRFALDFGLVGKTGHDLGLTWKTPSAFSPFSSSALLSKSGNDHSSKPLLKILPTGPAHEVLKMFRNRTVYANVVNDGIVPLRTSCLLFLDWKGLGRVEKARRENGTVGGLVEWGWGQLVTNGSSAGGGFKSTPIIGGLNIPSTFGTTFWGKNNGDEGLSPDKIPEEESSEVAKQIQSSIPVPEAQFTGEPTLEEQIQQDSDSQPLTSSPPSTGESFGGTAVKSTPNPLSSFIALFRPPAASRKPAGKIYHRSQTQPIKPNATSTTLLPNILIPPSRCASPTLQPNVQASDAQPSILEAPPRTSILEAAGDVLNPPLPSTEFIINPSSRPQTIFHDRVYHADEIPSPSSPSLPKRRTTGFNSGSHSPSPVSTPVSGGSTAGVLAVEEKIARAYHTDLSWRKVLVRLEPDAHNNMVVRRMFSNAYGWPVIQHIVETHFGVSNAATTPDNEEGEEKAGPIISESPLRDDHFQLERSDTIETSNWTNDAFISTDDESGDEIGETEAKDQLDAFLGIIPSSQPHDEDTDRRGKVLVGVSRVFAEASREQQSLDSESRLVPNEGVVGLGLGLGLGSLSGLGAAFRRSSADGSRAGSILDCGGSPPSQAVRLLERVNSGVGMLGNNTAISDPIKKDNIGNVDGGGNEDEGADQGESERLG